MTTTTARTESGIAKPERRTSGLKGTQGPKNGQNAQSSGISQGTQQHTLRVLLSCLREYRKPTLLAPGFVFVEGILEIIIPTVMAALIDQGISGKNIGTLWRFGIILLCCSVVSLVCGFLSGKYAAYAASGLAKNLRGDMFDKVQSFSFTNIDRFSTGSIITRLTTDVTNIQNAFQMIVRLGMRAPVMVIVSWIFAFRISPSISLVFLVTIPILGIGLIALAWFVHPIFERVFRTYDELNNVVDENLQAVRVVKSYNRENFEVHKFSRISQRIYDNFVKAEKVLSFNMPLMQLCMYATMIVIAWAGAHQIVASGNSASLGLTTGDLTALVTYAMQILMSMMMLSMIFVMVIISRASAERITQLLVEQSTVTNPAHPIEQVRDGSIAFDHVTFRYASSSEKPVLNDLSLTIPSGMTVGVVGGTGSSKSSLVQLIPRLYDVTGGSVKVGGVNVKDYDLEALRDSVAMVLQKNLLFTGTIKENLRWGNPHATDEQIVHACMLAQADGFIRELPDGYDTHIDEGGTNVSGGQRQRICIARALLKKPQILILDDSTSAVDTNTDRLIRRAFHEEIPDTTKIIIAQRIASVQESDLIIVMRDGEILNQGSHDELLENSEEYREIYESQTQNKEVAQA
ncbi:MAG: ABC transporter ATP-binding protein [Bifidobacterium sp.]|uniref:ABC transporter ATP-binding protein n=1 Tax=Bifidobacterium fermentum TaxID=3059035 RepID=A0AB39UMP6_9BIFI